MVALFAKYHSKGLNILGVSLDNDASKWKAAIQSDQLTWFHVSNLKQWEDPIAKLYQIESIPTTILIDKNGNIVGRSIFGSELEAKVQELLSK